MTQDQDATAAAVTVADDGGELLRELLGKVAGCFPRRETRQNAAEMVSGLLMELEDHNCWTIAEALGHAGPHRLQHLLSRAVWDDQEMLRLAASWAAGRLDDGESVLIVDETADAKSSADAAGAARQYSGTLGGIALCQVAVTLTYASGRGHTLIDRALYLPEARAADEEHRELAGSRKRRHSRRNRSWPISCWNARISGASAPRSRPGTRCTAAASCAAPSAPGVWGTCSRSAPIPPSPPALA